jgi:undecaprenyl-diphosphatase
LDVIEMLKAALFGLVEGVTEWLPISSTGHMLLLDQFVTLNVSQAFWDMFLVVIQLGAILAVCVLFFFELNPFSRKKAKGQRRSTWRLWAKIVVACIPAAVIGLPLDDVIEDYLSSPFVIAAALIAYGVAFIVIESSRAARAEELAASVTDPASVGPRHLAIPQAMSASELADQDARVTNVEHLDWKTVIGIGCFQVLSIVPGTSRSGSTIIGGLLLGCSRTVAAEFTFYLAVPVMFGASGLRLAKYLAKNAMSSSELVILLIGCIIAFLVSLVAIRFLMGFVKKHDFKPFGWYRIALGAVVIAYFALVR